MKLFGLIKKIVSTSTDSSGDSATKRELKKEDFYIVGIPYYLENIRKLTVSNPDYKSSAKKIIADEKYAKRIYQYTFVNKPVNLVEEPTNPHDKNAVKVIIAGEMVGHISMNDNIHVKDIINKHEIKYISSWISGGKWKIVGSGGDVFKSEDNIKIRITIAYV